MMRTCKPRYRDTRDCPQRYVPVEVREAIRDKYAWPGGYPLYIVMSDGEALCVDCGKKEYRQLAEASRDKDSSGWRPEAPAINYEEPDLYCCHCGERIESAYAEETMLIERVKHSGMWCISDIINGALVTRKYVGYSRKEAIQLFKQETKGH